MRKTILMLALAATPALVLATPDGDITYEGPDTTAVFISDILKEQQEINYRNDMNQHFERVWGRRSYLNIGYNNTLFRPSAGLPSGLPGQDLENKGTNWGLAIQYGRTYRLHKKPIVNTLLFGLDFTGIDLSINHYNSAGDGKVLYDSNFSTTVTEQNKQKSYYYTPWNLEQYEASFGMTIGPSLTLAPFNYLDVRELNYVKLNIYFHIGYQGSISYLINNDEADINPQSDSTQKDNFDKVGGAPKFEWAHGLLTNFGLSLSWRMIGIGYEHLVAHNRYKTLATSVFVDDTYKITTASDIIYLSIRLGR